MNYRWLRDFILWWLVAAACLTSVYSASFIVLLVGWLVLGVAQHAIGNLAHEGLHRQIHERSWINDNFARFCCQPFGLNLEAWRVWHARHHAYLGGPGDPEVHLKRSGGWRWHRQGQFALDLWGCGWKDLTRFWIDVNKGQAFNEAILLAILWLSISTLTHDWKLAAMWFFTMFTSQVAIFRLRTKWEHPIDILQITPMESKPPLWKRLTYLPCNGWDHWAHHEWPAKRNTEYPC